MEYDFSNCTLCPRKCGADRLNGTGFCGGGKEIRAAKAYRHMWEEPCLSGKNGSGTVFFSGCGLRCVFCQNYKISAENTGKEITPSRLGEIFLELQEQGAHNINLVTAGHYVPQVITALDGVKHKLEIPVAYNSGGYELVSTLKMLEGYIDIYLPDFKYYDNELAAKYSSAPDYRQVVCEALEEMYRQVGAPQYGVDGLLKKGMIVRHLILPTHRHDSIKVFEELKRRFGTEKILVSLMRQYTPFYHSSEFKELNRKVCAFEYNSVLSKINEMGFNGFVQGKASAEQEYIPDFDFKGI
ncbi:MAG: radical SAM protein [Oscillospiraceae bacterium]|nr:radical SAM protein [Oscillospiraceae bacterium]